MRAVVMHETGGPEVLRYEELPDPEPGAGEVLVRVEAAAVDHYELNQRAGMASEFPLILGSDGCGTREDDGERVLLTRANATYPSSWPRLRTRCGRSPTRWTRRPQLRSASRTRTAWWSVVQVGELKEGDTLLVQAGSSGTGQAAIDIGRVLGAKVYATASERKLDRIGELGAEPLAYDDPKLAELGADVVFDPVGGENFGRSVEALGPGGRLLTPGAVSDPQVSFNIWGIVGKGAKIMGIGSAPRSARRSSA